MIIFRWIIFCWKCQLMCLYDLAFHLNLCQSGTSPYLMAQVWRYTVYQNASDLIFFLHPTMSMFCFLCSNCWLHFNEFTICNLYHLRYHSSWFSFSHSVAFYWPRQLLLERVLKIWLIRQKDKWVRAIRVVLTAHCWSIALNFLNVSFNIFSRLVT